MEIVKSLSGGLPTVSDWKQSSEIWEAWRVQKGCPNVVKVAYRSREDVLIQVAHRLANQGRQYRWDRQGNSFPYYDVQEQM